jgi:hypothetical protein
MPFFRFSPFSFSFPFSVFVRPASHAWRRWRRAHDFSIHAHLPVAAGVGPEAFQANLQEALQHRRLPRRRGYYLFIAHDSRADADHA